MEVLIKIFIFFYFVGFFKSINKLNILLILEIIVDKIG